MASSDAQPAARPTDDPTGPLDAMQQLKACSANLADSSTRSAAVAEMAKVMQLLHAAPGQLVAVAAKLAAQQRQSRALQALVECGTVHTILQLAEADAPQDTPTRSSLCYVLDRVLAASPSEAAESADNDMVVAAVEAAAVSRASPPLVAFVLDTLLQLPPSSSSSSGESHHPARTYLSGLLQMAGSRGVDSDLMPRLLEDACSREAIWRTLRCREAQKLVFGVLLLRCCLGDKTPGTKVDASVQPPQEAATASASDLPQRLSLSYLLKLGAGEPLAAACEATEAVCKKWRSAVVVSQLRTVLLESFEVLAAADTAKTVNGYETAAWPDALVEAHARLVMATLEFTPLSKVLAYMLPYAAWSPVPARLLEKGGAPAVRLVVAALGSASLGDLASTSNCEAGLRASIQVFQLITGLLSIPEVAQQAVDAGAIQAAWMHLGVLAPLLQAPPPPSPEGEEGVVAAEAEDALPPQPQSVLEAAAATLAESALRLLITLVAHAPQGGVAALQALGGVELLQGGPAFEHLRGHAALGPLVAAALAAVAYGPPRRSDVAAWVSRAWAVSVPQMSVVQNLQWLLCILIGIALVGMVFLSEA